jgi:anti-anti-sigma factor
MSITIHIAHQGGVQILVVNGYLDQEACDYLDKELRRLLRTRRGHVILDCSALTFADARSLAQLFTLAGDFHRLKGDFRLAGLATSIARSARTAGFFQGIDHEDNVRPFN